MCEENDVSIPAARTHKMLLTLLAVALTVLAFVPLTAQADEVDDLLSVGSYIEGQAVVGFLSEGEGLTAQSSLPYAIDPLPSAGKVTALLAAGLSLVSLGLWLRVKKK